jgi:hypothetical protein
VGSSRPENSPPDGSNRHNPSWRCVLAQSSTVLPTPAAAVSLRSAPVMMLWLCPISSSPQSRPPQAPPGLRSVCPAAVGSSGNTCTWGGTQYGQCPANTHVQHSTAAKCLQLSADTHTYPHKAEPQVTCVTQEPFIETKMPLHKASCSQASECVGCTGRMQARLLGCVGRMCNSKGLCKQCH